MSGARWRRWLANAVDTVSIYLPLLLMGVLAALTYWLVRSTPLFEPPGPKPPVKQTPDYVVYDFALRVFAPDGNLRRVITGVEARHYPATERLEVDNVRIVSWSPDARVTQSSARKGLTNADGTEVQLLGEARVLRPGGQGPAKDSPSLEYSGEFLHVFTDTEQVKSHLPVTLKRNNDVFTANEMTYDNLQRVGELTGRVRAVIQPPSASSKGANP